MEGYIAPVPGARIIVRDAGWLVEFTQKTWQGAIVLQIVGVSEFIKGKATNFIDGLKSDLEVLPSKKTYEFRKTWPKNFQKFCSYSHLLAESGWTCQAKGCQSDSD